MNRKRLKAYLLAGKKANTVSTYLGANILARFCPNFVYHFKVTNGCPTDEARLGAQGFLHNFEHLPLLSWQAQQHDRLDVDLHDLTHPIFQSLQSRDERSLAIRKTNTHRASYSPCEVLPLPSMDNLPPMTPQCDVPRPQPFAGLQPPSEIKWFIPSPSMMLSRPLTMSVAPPAA
jgi:hypothetical protein